MTVRIYRSTDASAPALSGTAGALLTVLDAVLVNGYGSATAAGWTIDFTTTNKRQYKMAAGGTGFSLYIDDTGPGAGGAKEARFNGFEVGTAIGAGTGQFPTTGQQPAPSGQLVIRKSTTADSTARAWTIIADGHTIYMFIETGDVTAPVCSYPWMFGDFESYSSSDVWNCMVIGRIKENVQYFGSSALSTSQSWATLGANLAEAFCGLQGIAPNVSGAYLTETIPGHFVARNFSGVGGSTAVGKHSDIAVMGYNVSNPYTPQMGLMVSGPHASSAGYWPAAFPYPNATDGGLYVAPVYIHHGGYIRGYLKGFWAPLHHMPLGHGDTYSGTGNMSGKSLTSMSILGSSTNAASTLANMIPAQVHIEYSNTWS